MRSFFFFKQKTAYEMRISDWSSDVCSSDLSRGPGMIGNACLDTPPLAALGMNGWGECGWHERLTRSSREIGRASCRERVCQYVLISWVAVSFKKKQTNLSDSGKQISTKYTQLSTQNTLT